MSKYMPSFWVMNHNEFTNEFDVKNPDNGFVITSVDANKPDAKLYANLLSAAPEMFRFIESIVDASGPYTFVNGTPIVSRAYEIIKKAKGES